MKRKAWRGQYLKCRKLLLKKTTTPTKLKTPILYWHTNQNKKLLLQSFNFQQIDSSCKQEQKACFFFGDWCFFSIDKATCCRIQKMDDEVVQRVFQEGGRDYFQQQPSTSSSSSSILQSLPLHVVSGLKFTTLLLLYRLLLVFCFPLLSSPNYSRLRIGRNDFSVCVKFCVSF